MGKRELLIIAAFIVAGVIAYQVAAPSVPHRPGGFSLANLVGSIRRATTDGRITATATKTGTIAADDALTEVLVSNVVGLTVTGEARDDIAYTLTVQSGGRDPATAQQSAGRADLEQHDAASVLSLRATFVRDVRQTATLALRVPVRLGLRVEGLQGTGKIEVDNVASVDLEGVAGDVTIRNVAHSVTGAHHSGDLAVTDAGGVRLNVVASDLKLANITGPITVVARNGQVHIDQSRGAVDVDATNAETTVTAATNVVHVSGSGGSVTVERPLRAVTIDAQRTSVALTLAAAAAAAATVLTTDSPLRVTLDGAPDVTINATATDGGTIDAGDVGLAPEVKGQDTRLTHAFGRGRARVELLDERGTIVIRQSK